MFAQRIVSWTSARYVRSVRFSAHLGIVALYTEFVRVAEKHTRTATKCRDTHARTHTCT